MSPLERYIPEKYAKLKQAEAAGLAIPKSLLLEFEKGALANRGLVSRFVQSLPERRFIVRSAHWHEDGGEFSLAGHFWSSGPVMSGQVFATIQQAQDENAVVLKSLSLTVLPEESSRPPSLVLQAYIEHHVGGVVFSPWSHFPDYAYVEYSTTGVKQVVEGASTAKAVLSLARDYPDLINLPKEHAQLRQQLVKLCCELRQVYDFPVDCEWAYEYEKKRVIVLQVRPQTHRVGPILPYATSDTNKLNTQIGVGENWQFTGLSESLGRLSPLSFSLMRQLYIDATALFRTLGCRAKDVDFMRLAPDGSVLIDPIREAQFYSLTLFGGFKRGIQQAKLVAKASAVLKQYDSTAAFSYTALQQLFACWMGTNLLGAGAGRGGSKLVEFKAPVHAYELSWPAKLKPPSVKPAVTSLKSFEHLNAWARALFLFELNKLKLALKQAIPSVQRSASGYSLNDEAYVYFSAWGDLQSSRLTLDSANLVNTDQINLTEHYNHQLAKRYQHELAPLALYDYALASMADGGDVLALSSTKLTGGMLQIIHSPASSIVAIEAGSILVAPYFDSRWIGQIKLIKGIVVGRGSRLSHAAIVAREYEIPYYIVPALSLEKLSQGRHTILDCNTVSDLFTWR